MITAARKPAPNAVLVRCDDPDNLYRHRRDLAAKLARPLAIIDADGNTIAVTHPLPWLFEEQEGQV